MRLNADEVEGCATGDDEDGSHSSRVTDGSTPNQTHTALGASGHLLSFPRVPFVFIIPHACACMDPSAPGAYIRINYMHAKPCYHLQAYSSSDVRRVYGPPDIEGRACNGIKAFGCRETEVRSALLLQTPSFVRGTRQASAKTTSLQEVLSICFAHDNCTFTITVTLKDGIVKHSATSSHTAPR